METVKKVFVSLPMRGRPYEEIIKEQEEILAQAGAYIQAPVELLETCVPPDTTINPEIKNVALKCLSRSVGLMATADYIVFANDWKNACGCRIERTLAEEYGVPIIDLD